MSKWKQRFLNFAYEVSTWSKDVTKVGAVAVDDSKRILETGYNGIVRGVQEKYERMQRPEKYMWVAHAEENLVAHAARDRLQGSTVYVTHLCCSRCARLLINSGVSKVVYSSGKTSMPQAEFETAITMFNEAGVTLEEESND